MDNFLKNTCSILLLGMSSLTLTIAMEEAEGLQEQILPMGIKEPIDEQYMKELELKALEGDPKDQFRLVLAYIKRDVSDEKSHRLMDMLLKAADQGYKQALTHLCMFTIKWETEKVKERLFKAADANINWAFYTLGCLYESGSKEHGIEKDISMATNFFHRGALAGDNWCREWIIKKYNKLYSGNSLPVDAAKTAQFLKLTIDYENSIVNTYHSIQNQEARKKVTPTCWDENIELVDEEDLEEAQASAKWAHRRLSKLYT